LYTQNNEELYDLDPEGMAIIQSYAPPAPMLVPLIMLNPLNCTYWSVGRIPPIFLTTFVALLIASYMFTLLVTHEMVKLEVQKMRRRSFVPGANLRFLPFGFHIPTAVPNIAPWQPFNVIQAFVENFNAAMENDGRLHRNNLQPNYAGQVGVQARQRQANNFPQSGISGTSGPHQPSLGRLVPPTNQPDNLISPNASHDTRSSLAGNGAGTAPPNS
jgi:hypothetical protein